MIVVALAAAAAVLLALRPAPRRPPTVPGPSPVRWWLPVVSFAAMAVAGPVVAVALVVGLGGRALWRLRRRRQVATATADRVLETCELLAAELTAGQPPAGALARAADAWPFLAPAAEAGALGGDLPRTLRELATRPAPPSCGWSAPPGRSRTGPAAAWPRRSTGCRRSCAPTGRPVGSSRASSRPPARRPGWWPPSRCWSCCSARGAGTSPWTFLVATPIGWVCLAGGLALGLTGLWWIERIAAGVVG